MKRIRLVLGLWVLLAGWCMAAGGTGGDEWLSRDEILKMLVDGTRGILRRYHPETGKFGSEPWNCDDQNVIFPLAVAWATPGDGNPYYHSDELLAVIARAGEVLVENQDEQGRWVFRKKDGSEWGMSHKPWTYTRWIRAYKLVKDALPPESRAKWETGLLRGYNRLGPAVNRMNLHNIPTYHAIGVYVAGIVFEQEKWKQDAAAFLHRVMKKQAADGYWSEHYGPVVGYNYVYLEALGLYYHYSGDAAALEALSRGARFHASLLWRNGSGTSAVDERNAYTTARRIGNVGLSHTPEGRWYIREVFRHRKNLVADTAASFLLEGGSGGCVSPFVQSNRYLSQDKKYVMEREGIYQWCFSAYACKPVANRWIMDRQNHLEIEHERYGVIAGGGNSKMQPYFSSFTFGDIGAFQPDHTVKSPEFFPQTPLLWTADDARIAGRRLHLFYGRNHASVTVIPDGDALNVEYRLHRGTDGPVEAHLPLLCGSNVLCLNGRILGADQAAVSGRELNGGLLLGHDLVVRFPDNAVIRPGVRGFNPYHRYGRGCHPRTVIALPLSPAAPVARVRFEPLPGTLKTMMLWDGDLDALKSVATNCPAATLTVEDGALCVNGKTADTKSMYLRVDMKTPMFIPEGYRLNFDLEIDKAISSDNFYVKGIGPDGVVFSYRAPLIQGRVQWPVDLKLVTDDDKQFRLLDKQINAPPSALVDRLEFHYGRGRKNMETGFRIRNIRLIAAPPAAGKTR